MSFFQIGVLGWIRGIFERVSQVVLGDHSFLCLVRVVEDRVLNRYMMSGAVCRGLIIVPDNTI